MKPATATSKPLNVPGHSTSLGHHPVTPRTARMVVLVTERWLAGVGYPLLTSRVCTARITSDGMAWMLGWIWGPSGERSTRMVASALHLAAGYLPTGRGGSRRSRSTVDPRRHPQRPRTGAAQHSTPPRSGDPGRGRSAAVPGLAVVTAPGTSRLLVLPAALALLTVGALTAGWPRTRGLLRPATGPPDLPAAGRVWRAVQPGPTRLVVGL